MNYIGLGIAVFVMCAFTSSETASKAFRDGDSQLSGAALEEMPIVNLRLAAEKSRSRQSANGTHESARRNAIKWAINPFLGSVDQQQLKMPSYAKVTSVPANPVGTILSTTPSPGPTLVFTADGDASRPVDTNGAVGATQIVTVENGKMWISSRTGNFIDWITTEDLFGPIRTTCPGHIFDPRIIYDAVNRRFIHSSACGGNGAPDAAIFLAVSDGDDATGNWRLLSVSHNENDTRFTDYPQLGQDGTRIVVTFYSLPNPGVNDYFRHKVFVISKDALYSGLSVSPTIIEFPLSTFPILARSSDQSAGVPFYARTLSVGPEGDHIVIGMVRGTTTAPVIDMKPFEYTTGVTAVRPVPVRNPQWGTSGQPLCGIEAESHVGSMVEVNGSVWLTLSAYFRNGNHLLSGIYWAQIEPNAGTVLQAGVISRASEEIAHLCGGIAVNKWNEALIGVTETSAAQSSVSRYPSAGYFFRQPSDPAGFVRAANIYAPGINPLPPDYAPNSPRVRMGDYSASMLDPNGEDLWTVQERSGIFSSAVSWAKLDRASLPHGVPASISCLYGCSQSQEVNQTYPLSLTLRILDAFGGPASSGTVSLAAPSAQSGVATASIPSSVSVGANGLASINLVANNVPGAFQVVASLPNGANATYNMTNFSCSSPYFTSGGAVSGYPPTVARYSGHCGIKYPSSGSYAEIDPQLVSTRLVSRLYVNPNLSTGLADVFRIKEDGSSVTTLYSIRYNRAEQRFQAINRAGVITPIGAEGSVLQGYWYHLHLDWSRSNGQLDVSVQGAGASSPQNTTLTGFSALGTGGTVALYPQFGWISGDGAGQVNTDDFNWNTTGPILRLCRGDANGDGRVSVADRTSVTTELSGAGPVIGQPDCNEDGRVSPADRSCLTALLGTGASTCNGSW